MNERDFYLSGRAADTIASAEKVGGDYYINGKLCYKLPPGSHRPEQMLLSKLLEFVMPVCEIKAAVVKGEPGQTEFFSMANDVTDSEMLRRPLSQVRAEYVTLREVFLCKDRSFAEKIGYHYPGRKTGVKGHNMDWVAFDEASDMLKAVHYDFEDFDKFLTYMGEIWGSRLEDDKSAAMTDLVRSRIKEYAEGFSSSDFVPALITILESLQNRFTIEFVTKCTDEVVALQSKQDPKILHNALQNKIAFYLDILRNQKFL